LSAQRYNRLLMLKAAEIVGEEATVGGLTVAANGGQRTRSARRAAGLTRRQHSGRDGRRRILQLTAEGERRLLRAFNALAAVEARSGERASGHCFPARS
jgi:hypothetical protein